MELALSTPQGALVERTIRAVVIVATWLTTTAQMPLQSLPIIDGHSILYCIDMQNRADIFCFGIAAISVFGGLALFMYLGQRVVKATLSFLLDGVTFALQGLLLPRFAYSASFSAEFMQGLPCGDGFSPFSAAFSADNGEAISPPFGDNTHWQGSDSVRISTSSSTTVPAAPHSILASRVNISTQGMGRTNAELTCFQPQKYSLLNILPPHILLGVDPFVFESDQPVHSTAITIIIGQIKRFGKQANIEELMHALDSSVNERLQSKSTEANVSAAPSAASLAPTFSTAAIPFMDSQRAPGVSSASPPNPDTLPFCDCSIGMYQSAARLVDQYVIRPCVGPTQNADNPSSATKGDDSISRGSEHQIVQTCIENGDLEYMHSILQLLESVDPSYLAVALALIYGCIELYEIAGLKVSNVILEVKNALRVADAHGTEAMNMLTNALELLSMTMNDWKVDSTALKEAVSTDKQWMELYVKYKDPPSFHIHKNYITVVVSRHSNGKVDSHSYNVELNSTLSNLYWTLTHDWREVSANGHFESEDGQRIKHNQSVHRLVSNASQTVHVVWKDVVYSNSSE